MPTTPRPPKTPEGGITYFELATEIAPEDLPEPIRVPTSAGKYFVIEPMDTNRLITFRSAPTLVEMHQALLGDAWDEAVKFYGEKPGALWDKFIRAVTDHFFGRGAAAATPPGKDPA